jgi:tRNA(fMet)-specific endonuclease VapC
LTRLLVLDTDHISLLQRGHIQVTEHLDAVPDERVAASVISYEEQLRGRLALVRGAQVPDKLALAYIRLREMQRFFCAIRLLDFDLRATETYASLRKQHRRLGKMDLRIAATVLSCEGILVTRNHVDFGQIAGLSLEDWTQP